MSRYDEYLAIKARTGHDPSYEPSVAAALTTIYAASGNPAPRLMLWAESQPQATVIVGLLAAANFYVNEADRQTRLGGPLPLTSVTLGSLVADWRAQRLLLEPILQAWHVKSDRPWLPDLDRLWLGQVGTRAVERLEQLCSDVGVRTIGHPAAFDRIPTELELGRAMAWTVPSSDPIFQEVRTHASYGWAFPFASFEKCERLHHTCEWLDTAQIGTTERGLFAAYDQLVRCTYRVEATRHIAVFTQHPIVKRHDGLVPGRPFEYLFHATDGPALAWPDGDAYYALRGVWLPRDVGEAMVAGTLTIRQIFDQQNVEVRRSLIDLYNRGDKGRLLRDANARVLDSAVDARGNLMRLLWLDLEDDEPFVAIQVKNSTREPDGTFKTYTLRVHSELRPLPVPGVRDTLGDPQALSCHNAVASLHGMYGHEYAPTRET
jgi:hypothetical protein